MDLTYSKIRGGLPHFKQAMEQGRLTVGYLGGSITEAESLHNWPHFVNAWLLNEHPGLRLTSENIALGATGSDLALFRYERDLAPQRCQLIFVEYAVNDDTTPVNQRNCSREGLLRRLLQREDLDVVVVYTFRQEFYQPMMEGRMPDSIAEFERLCAHYNVSSVWMSQYTFDLVRRGLLRWDEWLPDGLHPQYAGSRLYAEAVCALLSSELHGQNEQRVFAGGSRPAPLFPNNWENCALIDYDDVQFDGPVLVERSQRRGAVQQYIKTTALGAKITIPFTGTGLLMATEFGTDAAEYLCSIDGGAPVRSCRERPAWCAKRAWFRTDVLAMDLPYGAHTCTLQVVHGDRDDCTSTYLEIGLLGVIR